MESNVNSGIAQINKIIELLLKASHTGQDAQYLPNALQWLVQVRSEMEKRLDVQQEAKKKKEAETPKKEKESPVVVNPLSNKSFVTIERIKGGWVAKKLTIAEDDIIVQALNEPGSYRIAFIRFMKAFKQIVKDEKK